MSKLLCLLPLVAIMIVGSHCQGAAVNMTARAYTKAQIQTFYRQYLKFLSDEAPYSEKEFGNVLGAAAAVTTYFQQYRSGCYSSSDDQTILDLLSQYRSENADTTDEVNKYIQMFISRGKFKWMTNYYLWGYVSATTVTSTSEQITQFENNNNGLSLYRNCVKEITDQYVESTSTTDCNISDECMVYIKSEPIALTNVPPTKRYQLLMLYEKLALCSDLGYSGYSTLVRKLMGYFRGAADQFLSASMSTSQFSVFLDIVVAATFENYKDLYTDQIIGAIRGKTTVDGTRTKAHCGEETDVAKQKGDTVRCFFIMFMKYKELCYW